LVNWQRVCYNKQVVKKYILIRKINQMPEKKTLPDVKDFIASVNKKNKKHNGKHIVFAFVNKKRK
jgi:hypothetical protein